jgi:hypothetical protein
MASVETFPDALEACHRNERLTGSALMACALKQMQDNYKNQTVADCRGGEEEHCPTNLRQQAIIRRKTLSFHLVRSIARIMVKQQ